VLIAFVVLLVGARVDPVRGQGCTGNTPLQNFTGGGQVACPCFVTGEQAGAVFTAEASHYPIEIVAVGIGWGSQFGGAPQSLEQAIHIYEAGLPNPGTPIFSLVAPLLNDGFINAFDISAIPGNKIVLSGSFTIALEFANANSGDIFAPTMVHDGNGCQSGKNVVKAVPGGWFNACALGVSGDWVVTVTYRCLAWSDAGEMTLSNRPDRLLVHPNPFAARSLVTFDLAATEQARLAVYNVLGRRIATLTDRIYPAGRHVIEWAGTDRQGQRVPAGIYFVRLQAGTSSATKKVIVQD
jgi:hypothetical protein